MELLKSIGIKNVRLTGDTRFDRVKQIAENAKQIVKVEQFCDGHPAIVCGSTWPPDEEILLEYINCHPDGYKWIIVPHEIGENHIKAILDKCRKKVARYTSENTDLAGKEVLIIDCIGLLSSIYRYGKIAYIGGGFGVGIHNTLEAAVYGIPVIFRTQISKIQRSGQPDPGRRSFQHFQRGRTLGDPGQPDSTSGNCRNRRTKGIGICEQPTGCDSSNQ